MFDRGNIILYNLNIFYFLIPLYRVYRASRKAKWLFVRPQKIKSYLNRFEMRKLQLGGGSHPLAGWLNTDLYPFQAPEVIFLDATKPFPFKDGTFDYIFSEHMIEHINYQDGLFMLRECYRILKPGGKIRIATPDLSILANLYRAEKTENQKRYIKSVIDTWLPDIEVYNECFALNNMFRNFGHQFIYDQSTLQCAMEKLGFIEVTRYPIGESDDEVFRGIEFHLNDEAIRFETMVLEAKCF